MRRGLIAAALLQGNVTRKKPLANSLFSARLSSFVSYLKESLSLVR